MNEILERIYEIENLAELEIFLRAWDRILIRERLLGEFDRYAFYKNASEWNKAVKICECLSDRRLGRARELGGTAREILQRVARGIFFKCARRAALCRSYVVEAQNRAYDARRRYYLFHAGPDAAGKTLARP